MKQSVVPVALLLIGMLIAAACAEAEPTRTPTPGRIAFASTRDGNEEIYVLDADGSNQTRLTNNPADDELPAWSPGRVP